MKLPLLVLASATLAACSKDKPVVLVQDAAPLNATPVASTAVVAQVNPDHLPAYSGPTGSVEGTIFVTGVPAGDSPTKKWELCNDGSAAATYGKIFREGAPKEPGGPRWLADAVVAITGYKGYFVPETKEAHEVTIDGCAFSARTITMTFGQRLEVKNRTDRFWTPVFEPPTSGVLMMAVPNGEAVKLNPKREGHYLLIDRDRLWAFADVYVLRHPLHTVSAVGGHYRIDGIPAGKLKVNATHPSLPLNETSADVEIRSDAVAHVDLTLESRPPPPPVDAGAALPRARPDAGPTLH